MTAQSRQPVHPSQQPLHAYDAAYYATGLGPVPYTDRGVWLPHFRNVAALIIDVARPASVFDAGCAFGYLVEALRERGVDASGADISDYAISQAAPDVRPFLSVAPVDAPLTRQYDLITCIEVLEHVDAAAGAAAIANFCQHGDAVLFSSSPDDHVETSHINVQPPGHWAALFARHGFARVLSADISALTPWAAIFQRQDTTPEARLSAYEDALTRSRGEVVALKRELARLQQHARALENVRGGGRAVRTLKRLRRLVSGAGAGSRSEAD
jgi:SAM-dependent methyltransferase